MKSECRVELFHRKAGVPQGYLLVCCRGPLTLHLLPIKL